MASRSPLIDRKTRVRPRRVIAEVKYWQSFNAVRRMTELPAGARVLHGVLATLVAYASGDSLDGERLISISDQHLRTLLGRVRTVATVQRYLRKLVECGLVRTETRGRRRWLAVARPSPPHFVRIMPSVLNDTGIDPLSFLLYAEIVSCHYDHAKKKPDAALLVKPGWATNQRLADALGIDETTVERHMSRLETGYGLIQRRVTQVDPMRRERSIQVKPFQEGAMRLVKSPVAGKERRSFMSPTTVVTFDVMEQPHGHDHVIGRESSAVTRVAGGAIDDQMRAPLMIGGDALVITADRDGDQGCGITKTSLDEENTEEERMACGRFLNEGADGPQRGGASPERSPDVTGTSDAFVPPPQGNGDAGVCPCQSCVAMADDARGEAARNIRAAVRTCDVVYANLPASLRDEIDSTMDRLGIAPDRRRDFLYSQALTYGDGVVDELLRFGEKVGGTGPVESRRWIGWMRRAVEWQRVSGRKSSLVAERIRQGKRYEREFNDADTPSIVYWNSKEWRKQRGLDPE